MINDHPADQVPAPRPAPKLNAAQRLMESIYGMRSPMGFKFRGPRQLKRWREQTKEESEAALKAAADRQAAKLLRRNKAWNGRREDTDRVTGEAADVQNHLPGGVPPADGASGL